MTTTHTAASLAALHADDPRKLDALAAEIVMGQCVIWRNCYRDPECGGWSEVERWGDQGDGRQPCEVIHSVGYDYDNASDTLLDDGNHYWWTYFEVIPRYSASLDAAALLQQRLAERGLRHNHKANSILIYHVLELFPMDNYDLNEYAIDAAIHATAAQRTIAAILAAQEATK